MTIVENTLPEQAAEEIKLSRLYLMLDLLNVMQANLNLQLNAQPGDILSTTKTNLFALASKTYGDATLWTEIANSNQSIAVDSNGFVDPNIHGVHSLIIPPKTSVPSGGIYVI